MQLKFYYVDYLILVKQWYSIFDFYYEYHWIGERSIYTP